MKQKQSQRVSQVVKINISGRAKRSRRARAPAPNPSLIKYSQPISPFQFQSPFGLPSELNRAIDAIIEPQLQKLQEIIKLNSAIPLNNTRTVQMDDIQPINRTLNNQVEIGSNALGQQRSFDNPILRPFQSTLGLPRFKPTLHAIQRGIEREGFSDAESTSSTPKP